MGSLSSGSSDDDLNDYTITNTLLGYASKDPTDDPVNQLGGQPVSMALTIGPIMSTPSNMITSVMARPREPSLSSTRQMQSLQPHDDAAVATQW